MPMLEPASIEELSAILRDASGARRTLIPVGGRTGVYPTPSAAGASMISTRALPSTVDHVAGDLVATIPAGVALADANAMLAREHQCLALDPPFASRATIGGIVAANESGPRRHRYGSPRDLIIGIGVALADGRTAKAGGKVVKNVAGYDLSRLMCGSLGSLSVITSATFKLSPIPARSKTVVAILERRERLGDLLQALVNAPLTPSAIEIVAPPARVLIRFETTDASAAHMAQQASAICVQHGAPAVTLTGASEDEAWTVAESAVWAEHGTILKIAVLPTDVPYLLDQIETGCAAHGVAWRLQGRAALGVLYIRMDGPPESLESLIADWRHRASVNGGSLVIQAAQPGLERVDRWGESPDAFAVMRAVKTRFDPNGILCPGMGPGGL
ncbi:MAG TPA: FAD-binding oxidoreductase [Vicinamibacterales bacterium]|jgi:glycolate oxidase FAD binding subunit|nr:FAD-binding oxidoreductase [Vicinamibacterales bacterium]